MGSGGRGRAGGDGVNTDGLDYDDCVTIAEAMASAADSFRATLPEKWLDRSARGRFIREKQDAAAYFALLADKLRRKQAVSA